MERTLSQPSLASNDNSSTTLSFQSNCYSLLSVSAWRQHPHSRLHNNNRSVARHRKKTRSLLSGVSAGTPSTAGSRLSLASALRARRDKHLTRLGPTNYTVTNSKRRRRASELIYRTLEARRQLLLSSSPVPSSLGLSVSGGDVTRESLTTDALGNIDDAKNDSIRRYLEASTKSITPPLYQQSRQRSAIVVGDDLSESPRAQRLRLAARRSQRQQQQLHQQASSLRHKRSDSSAATKIHQQQQQHGRNDNKGNKSPPLASIERNSLDSDDDDDDRASESSLMLLARDELANTQDLIEPTACAATQKHNTKYGHILDNITNNHDIRTNSQFNKPRLSSDTALLDTESRWKNQFRPTINSVSTTVTESQRHDHSHNQITYENHLKTQQPDQTHIKSSTALPPRATTRAKQRGHASVTNSEQTVAIGALSLNNVTERVSRNDNRNNNNNNESNKSTNDSRGITGGGGNNNTSSGNGYGNNDSGKVNSKRVYTDNTTPLSSSSNNNAATVTNSHHSSRTTAAHGRGGLVSSGNHHRRNDHSRTDSIDDNIKNIDCDNIDDSANIESVNLGRRAITHTIASTQRPLLQTTKESQQQSATNNNSIKNDRNHLSSTNDEEEDFFMSTALRLSNQRNKSNNNNKDANNKNKSTKYRLVNKLVNVTSKTLVPSKQQPAQQQQQQKQKKPVEYKRHNDDISDNSDNESEREERAFFSAPKLWTLSSGTDSSKLTSRSSNNRSTPKQQTKSIITDLVDTSLSAAGQLSQKLKSTVSSGFVPTNRRRSSSSTSDSETVPKPPKPSIRGSSIDDSLDILDRALKSTTHTSKSLDARELRIKEITRINTEAPTSTRTTFELRRSPIGETGTNCSIATTKSSSSNRKPDLVIKSKSSTTIMLVDDGHDNRSSPADGVEEVKQMLMRMRPNASYKSTSTHTTTSQTARHTKSDNARLTHQHYDDRHSTQQQNEHQLDCAQPVERAVESQQQQLPPLRLRTNRRNVSPASEAERNRWRRSYAAAMENRLDGALSSQVENSIPKIDRNRYLDTIDSLSTNGYGRQDEPKTHTKIYSSERHFDDVNQQGEGERLAEHFLGEITERHYEPRYIEDGKVKVSRHERIVESFESKKSESRQSHHRLLFPNVSSNAPLTERPVFHRQQQNDCLENETINERLGERERVNTDEPSRQINPATRPSQTQSQSHHPTPVPRTPTASREPPRESSLDDDVSNFVSSHNKVRSPSSDRSTPARSTPDSIVERSSWTRSHNEPPTSSITQPPTSNVLADVDASLSILNSATSWSSLGAATTAAAPSPISSQSSRLSSTTTKFMRVKESTVIHPTSHSPTIGHIKTDTRPVSLVRERPRAPLAKATRPTSSERQFQPSHQQSPSCISASDINRWRVTTAAAAPSSENPSMIERYTTSLSSNSLNSTNSQSSLLYDSGSTAFGSQLRQAPSGPHPQPVKLMVTERAAPQRHLLTSSAQSSTDQQLKQNIVGTQLRESTSTPSADSALASSSPSTSSTSSLMNEGPSVSAPNIRRVARVEMPSAIIAAHQQQQQQQQLARQHPIDYVTPHHHYDQSILGLDAVIEPDSLVVDQMLDAAPGTRRPLSPALESALPSLLDDRATVPSEKADSTQLQSNALRSGNWQPTTKRVHFNDRTSIRSFEPVMIEEDDTRLNVEQYADSNEHDDDDDEINDNPYVATHYQRQHQNITTTRQNTFDYDNDDDDDGGFKSYHAIYGQQKTPVTSTVLDLSRRPLSPPRIVANTSTNNMADTAASQPMGNLRAAPVTRTMVSHQHQYQHQQQQLQQQQQPPSQYSRRHQFDLAYQTEV